LLIPEFKRLPAVVAIPARNEAVRIERCLASLAMQRDSLGAPVARNAFEVVLFANNCTDETAQRARAYAALLPYRLSVIEADLVPDQATAGGARRLAMDEAARRLSAFPDGIILTTDADSTVAPTWFANTCQHLRDGADCVAGTIDAEPPEIIRLGPDFVERGRLEDTYLRLVAEIYARCDPRAHDPWPNHRVSSGASLAVTLRAYQAVGGLPPRALGEDIAFTRLLDRRSFKVRHALDVAVMTSGRLDGRAAGGAADTMRHRRDVPDAVCDDELEPALYTLRRAVIRGLLRHACREGRMAEACERVLPGYSTEHAGTETFAEAWEVIGGSLERTAPLRPSGLPRQIAIARFILRHLRQMPEPTGVPDDKLHRAKSYAMAIASPLRLRKDRWPGVRSGDNWSGQANGRE